MREEKNYDMHPFLIGEHQFPGKGITIYFDGLTG
jgi:hypothetical protein